MKKIFFFIFLLSFCLYLAGCVDTPNGPDSLDPYGEYDNSLLYSSYPYQVSQKFNYQNFKFNVETSIPGIIGEAYIEFLKVPKVINLEEIKCDSYKDLFNASVSNQYLKENYKALWFIREEPIDTNVLEDIEYNDLFIENKKIYVTINYKSQTVGEEALSYYEELILIPNEWEEKIGNFEINYNIKNHPYGNYTITKMSYKKMIEFKNTYREQKLNNKYDDMLYREIYMLDVYGEYNNCLVATVTYDDYVHTDEELQLKEIFRHPLGYYINVVYDGHYPIWVYNDNKLFTLSEAYNKGFLTIDDIKDISVKSYKNLLGHTHNYIDGLCECKEYDVNWLNENFRLFDEQILFNGSADEEFDCDVILLTLKHTKTYIELSERHFGIDEITKVLYISTTPPSYFYEPGNEDRLNNFKQVVFLYVNVNSKEEIIELIKEIEKLPFVESASPNYIEYVE